MQTTHNVQSNKDVPLSNQKTTQKADQQVRSIPDAGSNISRDQRDTKPHFEKDKPAGDAMWSGGRDVDRADSPLDKKEQYNRPIEQQAQSRPPDKQQGTNQAPRADEQLPKKAPAKYQS
jgi:hypothetical protein